MRKIGQLANAIFGYIGLCVTIYFSLWLFYNFNPESERFVSFDGQVYLIEKSWWGLSEDWKPIFYRYDPAYKSKRWMTQAEIRNQELTKSIINNQYPKPISAEKPDAFLTDGEVE